MSRAAQLRAAIRRLTGALSGPQPVHTTRKVLVEEARRLTGAASSALCLLTEDREMLDYASASGDNAGELTGLRVRVADSLLETVVKTGQSVLVEGQRVIRTGDLFADMEFPAGYAAVHGESLSVGTMARRAVSAPAALLPKGVVGIRSAVMAPIHRNGTLIGVLSALNKDGERAAAIQAAAFDSEDAETLKLLAEFYGLAMEQEETARMTREQSRELAVLYDAARTVAGSLNVQEVMDSVLDAICAHLEPQTAVLFLLNEERTHLFAAAERGLTDDEREAQLPADEGIAARVLNSGEPIRITDVEQEPAWLDLSVRAQAACAMLAPIRSRDEIHGIILVASAQRHAYTESDLKLLTAVAMQAGIAIENARLYEDAQRQADEAAALYDLSQHVNATLHLDRVLHFVADSVLNLLKVDKFALMLYDRREDRLVTRLSRHVDEVRFGAVKPRVGEGIAGWVYEWQTPQAVTDVASDPRNRTAPIDGAGVASTLCVPMHVGDNVIGVMHAMSSYRRLFTVAEMELLYTISNQAAVAIVNAMLYQDARSRSHELQRYFQRTAHALGSALDSQDLPQLLADLAIEIMRADRCALYRLDGDTLRLQAASRFRTSAPPDNEVSPGVGLCGWVARRGQSLILSDLENDPRRQAHAWLQRDRLASYLAIPLKVGRRTVGVAEIYTQDRRVFTDEEVQLLATFARRARVAEKMTRRAG